MQRGDYQLTSFPDAIAAMDIPEGALRVESIDRGASNVVANVNCGGVTWAVAVRSPVDGYGDRFAAQKVRTAAVTQYLASIFAQGIQLADNSRFVFDGVSALTDSNSTSEFFRRQAKRAPLRINDTFRPLSLDQELRPLTENQFDSTYDGAYFVSKGAPATETLMDSIGFADLMLRGLAALHVRSGASTPIPISSLDNGVRAIEDALASAVEVWEKSPGAASISRIQKYDAKFGSSKGIRQEVFLQSDDGRSLIADQVRLYFPEMMDEPRLRCFIHGDAHGRNFIVVQFGFTVLSGEDAFLDRTYINGLFAEFDDLQRLTIENAPDGSTVTYRTFCAGDEDDERCSVVIRSTHDDVHLIDPDTGRGIEESEKECYLFDLVTLCLSIRNWCRIHGAPVRTFNDLIDVYNIEFANQLTAVRIR